jgi:hypothetical protein
VSSQIEICNLALIHAGQSQSIAALNESSTAAAVLTTVWPMARDAAIMAAPWDFAQRWGALAQLPASPTTDWLYAYAWPTDCLQINRILSGAGRIEAAPVAFACGNSGGQSLVLTDQPDAVADYTIRVTDASQYPPDFVMALSMYLASLICPALSVKFDVAQGLRAEYKRLITAAITSAANRQVPGEAAACEFLAVRDATWPATWPA